MKRVKAVLVIFAVLSFAVPAFAGDKTGYHSEWKTTYGYANNYQDFNGFAIYTNVYAEEAIGKDSIFGNLRFGVVNFELSIYDEESWDLLYYAYGSLQTLNMPQIKKDVASILGNVPVSDSSLNEFTVDVNITLVPGDGVYEYDSRSRFRSSTQRFETTYHTNESVAIPSGFAWFTDFSAGSSYGGVGQTDSVTTSVQK